MQGKVTNKTIKLYLLPFHLSDKVKHTNNIAEDPELADELKRL